MTTPGASAAPGQRWEDLQPDPRLRACLDESELAAGTRSSLITAEQTMKKEWSKAYANATARMVAAELARQPRIKTLGLQVRPSAGESEPLSIVLGGKTKRVDVTASSAGSGLQIGFSLKGANWRDLKDLNFDKNLTGRSYELSDEMRKLHEYQPHAHMVALYFVPIGGTCDKMSRSSFAHMVQYLREHSGREDHLAPGQMRLFDSAFVGLYVPGDDEDFEYVPKGRDKEPKRFQYRDPFPRGVVRYFNVLEDPPKYGRPKVETTLNLKEMVELVVAKYTGEGDAMAWVAPEPDGDDERIAAAGGRGPIIGDEPGAGQPVVSNDDDDSLL